MFHEYSSTLMRKRPPQGMTIPVLRKGKLPTRAFAQRSRLKRELTQKGARFEYSISMFVQANDCRAIQCKPIAQQSALIVAMRPARRSTNARLGLANFDVNHCFAPAFGANAPLPSSR